MRGAGVAKKRPSCLRCLLTPPTTKYSLVPTTKYPAHSPLPAAKAEGWDRQEGGPGQDSESEG